MLSIKRGEFQSAGKRFKIGWIGTHNKDQPPPDFLPDPDDYDLFSAYARYRILVNHLSRGWTGDAATVYTTLLDKVPTTSKGYPFVELATLLWKTYQQTKDIKEACAPVIEYLKDHPDIPDLIGGPYGDTPFGNQTHTYIPEDLCPFN